MIGVLRKSWTQSEMIMPELKSKLSTQSGIKIGVLCKFFIVNAL